MAIVNRRIYHINDSPSAILNGQLCYEPTADADLGYQMWCGKDDNGYITKWLAKNEDAMVGSLWIKCDTTLELDGYLKHNSLGLVIGNNTAIESITGLQGIVDGPVIFTGDGVVQGGPGNRTFTFTATGVGGVTDHGSLSGLDDPGDHTWALLVDGSRSLGGNWSLGGYDLSGVSVLNSVNVSASGELSLELGYTWGAGRYGISIYSRYGAAGAESGIDIFDNGTTSLYSTGGGRVATTESLLAFSDKSFADSPVWTSGEINWTASGATGIAEVAALHALLGDSEGSAVAAILAASASGGSLWDAYKVGRTITMDATHAGPVVINSGTQASPALWLSQTQSGFVSTSGVMQISNAATTLEWDEAPDIQFAGAAGGVGIGHRLFANDAISVVAEDTHVTGSDSLHVYSRMTNRASSDPWIYSPMYLAAGWEWTPAVGQNTYGIATIQSSFEELGGEGNVSSRIELYTSAHGASYSSGSIKLLSQCDGPAGQRTSVLINADIMDFDALTDLTNINGAYFRPPYSLGAASAGALTANFDTYGNNLKSTGNSANITSFTLNYTRPGTYFLRIDATASITISGFPSEIDWHGDDPDVDTVTIPTGKHATLVFTQWGDGTVDGTVSVVS